MELNAQGAVTDRIIRSVNGRLIRSQQHGWYLKNVRGDVVQRVNDARVVQRVYRYSAFGIEHLPSANNTNPFRFAGEYFDRETGNYYTPNRHFNPRLGRWTQPDPLWNHTNMIFGVSPTMRNDRYMPSIAAILQAGNLYVFTMNNPVMWIDPTGLAADRAIPTPTRVAATAFANRSQSASSGSLPATSTQPASNNTSTNIFARVLASPLNPFSGAVVLGASASYAAVQSTSIGIEYGVGIGGDVRAGVLQGRVDVAVVRNTVSLSSQGITRGDWTFYTGAFIGPTFADVKAGAYLRMPANPDENKVFAGVKLPGTTMGVSNQEGFEATLSVGASAYFGVGGGANITLNLNQFGQSFQSAMRRWR